MTTTMTTTTRTTTTTGAIKVHYDIITTTVLISIINNGSGRHVNKKRQIHQPFQVVRGQAYWTPVDCWAAGCCGESSRTLLVASNRGIWPQIMGI